jgi:glyoxylase-like metal-dependent hydrolase (beta-lactamase superfamily II)
VVNTHCHADHIGGNAILRKELNATIAVHEADTEYVENRDHQFESLFGSFHVDPDLTVSKAEFMKIAGPDTSVDRRLADGDIVDLGDMAFEVVYTPGHSHGSIVLYEPKTKLLLASDSIQCNGTTDTNVPMIIDFAAYIQSLERLASYDVSMLITAHPFMPHVEAFFNENDCISFINESKHLAYKYLEQVAYILLSQNKPVSLLEIGRKLAQELEKVRVNPYLIMLTSACLDELEIMGKAERLSGKGWGLDSTFTSS